VGDRTDQLAVLDDGRAAHECVQVGTTHFYKLLFVSTLFIKKTSFRIVIYICFMFQEDGKCSFPWVFSISLQSNSLDDSC
jgi:hypothetical protein